MATPPNGSDPGHVPVPLRFVCHGCGTPLVLPDARSAASGPCPKCAAWIDAAKFPVSSAEPGVPATRNARRRRHDNMIAGKGRVRADGFIDHSYNERRELFGTLRLLAVSLAVFAVILLVILYMKHRMVP